MQHVTAITNSVGSRSKQQKALAKTIKGYVSNHWTIEFPHHSKCYSLPLNLTSRLKSQHFSQNHCVYRIYQCDLLPLQVPTCH